MKSIWFARFSPVLALVAALGFAAPALARYNPVAVFSLSSLDARTAAVVANSTVPVVIEFIDPAGTGDECKNAPAAFDQAAQEFAGKATLITAYVNDQDPNMIASTRVAVCPTYFFILDKSNQNEIVARRIWGYLGESQLAEILNEFWKITP